MLVLSSSVYPVYCKLVQKSKTHYNYFLRKDLIMIKQNCIVATQFSVKNQFSICTLFDTFCKGIYEGGIIKVILILFLICNLHGIVYANTTKTNRKDVSSKKTSVNNTPVFSKLLELYSIYSSEKYDGEQDLFKLRDAEEEIETIMKRYTGKSSNLPIDFDCKIVVDDDYDTKGIKIIINLPIRCYAHPINNDEHVKKVIMNNSSGPFESGAFYIKCPYKDLVPVFGVTRYVNKDWKHYNSAYIKEKPYNTQLTIYYLDSEEVMKELYKNSEKYKIHVRIKNLSFLRPKAIGYFRARDLIENGYDTTPLYNKETSYYASNTIENINAPPQKVLFATIDSISIINNRTNKEFVQIKFEPDCQIPDSIKINNEIAFQAEPFEDLSSISVPITPSLQPFLIREFGKQEGDEFEILKKQYDNLNRKYNTADAFDKKTIKKEIDKLNNLISQKDFQRTFKLENVYIPRNFNKNQARLFIKTPWGFRFEDNVSFNMHNIEKIILSDSFYNDYCGHSSHHHHCYNMRDDAFFAQYYFYTSKQELAPIKNSQYRIEDVRIEGGSLFYKEELFTTVVLDVITSIEDLKDIYNNYDNYEFVVVYNDLKQIELPYCGFFNEDALLMLDGNTRLLRGLEFSTSKDHTPYYFIVHVKNEDKPDPTFTILTAKIKSIYVVNKKTKKIIAKADAKEQKNN